MSIATDERPTDLDDPWIGTVLDNRYRLLRRIGAGGMGAVYEAVHEVLNTRVAIKLLHPAYSDEAEPLERLRREAQAASQIGSPHIVDVRDFGQAPDGSTYMVLELIEGVSLFRELLFGAMPFDRAAVICVQMADALQEAHARGIVHRDLKPENILLTTRHGRPDFVKIVDFGIARMQGTAKITVDGNVVGTPQYMSPEQCAGLEIDSRTDIYSLGVVLYQMVTGQLPFDDPNLTRLIALHLREDPVPPTRAAPEADIPTAIEETILRCLAKRPADRIGTMRALAQELRPFARSRVSATAPTIAPGEATIDAPINANDGRTLDDDDNEDGESTFMVAKREAEEDARLSRANDTQRRASAKRRWWMWALGAVILAAAAGGLWAAHVRQTETSLVSTTEETSEQTVSETDELPTGMDLPTRESSALDAVTIESVPNGAEVYEGEAYVGVTPYRFPRPEAREHITLRIERAGYRPRTVRVNAMAAAVLNVELERIGASGAAPRPDDSVPLPEEPPVTPTPPEPTKRRPFLDPWVGGRR